MEVSLTKGIVLDTDNQKKLLKKKKTWLGKQNRKDVLDRAKKGEVEGQIYCVEQMCTSTGSTVSTIQIRSFTANYWSNLSRFQ